MHDNDDPWIPNYPGASMASKCPQCGRLHWPWCHDPLLIDQPEEDAGHPVPVDDDLDSSQHEPPF